MKRLYSLLIRHRHLLISITALPFAGCAGVSYTSIPNETADRHARGFRYYDTSPYVLVKTNNQGGLDSSVLYLPDTTKKRSARPYAFLATNTTTLTFGDKETEGLTLTQGSSDAKSDDIPVEIAKVLGAAAKQAFTGGTLDRVTPMQQAPTGSPKKAPTFALFKVVKQSGEWGLIGAQNQPVKYLP